MGIRLVSNGSSVTVDGQTFAPDASGVVELPDEHAEHAFILIESHGFDYAPEPEPDAKGKKKATE